MWQRQRVLIALICGGVASPSLSVDSAQGQVSIDGTLAAAIDRQFVAVDRSDSPGCALGIYQDGKMRYARGYGMADVRRGEPLSSTSVFEIASISKQFVAGVVALLADEGVVSMKDDVRRYVPELPDYGARITIDQLVHHTSGIPDLPAWQAVGVRIPETLDGRLSLMARRPVLDFTPGSAFSYRNVEYELLKTVAERATHITLTELTATRVLRPLGMKRSFMGDRTGPAPEGVVTGYRAEAGAAAAIDRRRANSIFTSVEDLLHWDENFYSGVVGGVPWARRIVTAGTLSDGSPIAYAFGNWVGSYRGLPVVRHDGVSEGFRTYLLRFPTRHTSIAVLCNTESVQSITLGHNVADILLSGLFPDGDTTKPQPNAPSATRWSGSYVDTLQGVTRQVAADGANLRAPSYGDPNFVAVGGTRFRNLHGTVELEFVEGRDGLTALRQRFLVGGATEILARVTPWSPTAEQLADFAGVFQNTALGVTHEITLSGNKLLIRIGGDVEPRQLQPFSKDVFEEPRLTMVRFVRGADGRVSGYRVHMPRAWGIPFERRPP